MSGTSQGWGPTLLAQHCAAESGLDLKAYAEQAGKAYRNLVYKAQAWRVMASAHVCIADIRDSWRNLAEIHAAPEWLWAAFLTIEGPTATHLTARPQQKPPEYPLARRHLTAGQRAMAHAMLYPDAKHGGAREKGQVSSGNLHDISKGTLSRARYVLRHPDLARGGPVLGRSPRGWGDLRKVAETIAGNPAI